MTATREAAPSDLDGTISVDELRTVGERVRDEAGIKNGVDAFSECRDLSQALTSELERCDVEAWVLEAHMGEARETHYCVYLPVDTVDDVYYRDGGVVVDPTMDQFCTENAQNGKTDVDFGPDETLPAVAIHEPDAEERIVSYFRPKTPPGVYHQFPYQQH